MTKVEKWDIFEVEVKGKAEGNPFTDYTICGTFRWEGNSQHAADMQKSGSCKAGEAVTVDGFYDGDDSYKVRFMPSFEGIYTYRIEGSFSDEVTEGSFEVTPPVRENNHGPVRVVDGTHLGYEDGTPYYSIGTTCYAWVNQNMELQEQTLKTLQEAPFNKIRFCIFPKFYIYNKKEPLTYPFERGNGQGLDTALVEKEKKEKILFPGVQAGVPDYDFDYYRFNVEHFRRFDLRIRQLRDMGIEADVILMHPYDRWGMNVMKAECCDNYLRYVVARYGAYRNVWWSLANEYDLIPTKSEADWERYAAIICKKDPYVHLRSIHNCNEFYDYSKPWVTHCSMQRQDFYRTTEFTEEYIEKYQKPVVWDEICYEGNIELGWGNIPGQELVRRFWEAFLRGGHCGHGETFFDENDILWWSHGGILKGESAPRLQFLLDILKEVPGGYLKKTGGMFDEVVGIPSTEEKEDIPFHLEVCGYELHYLGLMQPACRMLFLPEDARYQVDVIDTWDMTVTSAGVHSGLTTIELPQKQYMAIRLIRL